MRHRRRKGPSGGRRVGGKMSRGSNVMQTHRLVRKAELRARRRVAAKRWAVVLGLDLAGARWGGDDMLTAKERKGRSE